MEDLLDAGLRGSPTLQNVLVSICKLMMMGATSNRKLGLAPVCYRRVQVQLVVCWLLIIAMLPYAVEGEQVCMLHPSFSWQGFVYASLR